MGGELYCKSKVSGLILENNRVTGIRLWDGTVHLADQVIWAADGYNLHYEILGGRYLNDKIRQMYENWKPVKPIVHLMLGVNRDFSDQPHRLVLEMEEPITIARRRHTWMAVNHHCFDKTMAPEGKSVVEVWIDTEYEYWEHLAQNRNAYNNEKRRIADHMIRELEIHWPGFTSQIEVIDIPTPVTYHRYTGNWKGSPDGWYLTPENIKSMEPIRTIPKLEGLYMAGQWTSPFTGTVIAALTGRQIIQLLCRADKKKFYTRRPVETTQKVDVLIG
jgi:phytoene dehydrogenase-like protein